MKATFAGRSRPRAITRFGPQMLPVSLPRTIILSRSTFYSREPRQIASDQDVSTRSFNKTLAALEGAAQAATDLRDFDLDDFETLDAVKAFEDALALIKESFLSLKVSLVLYTMYVHGVEHFPHSLTRQNGPIRRRNYYLMLSRGIGNVWRTSRISFAAE
jgi:hypothetical protein